MSFSIEQFCKRHSISRSTWYKLPPDKRPRTMKVMDCIRISEDAERDWVKAREAETSTEVAA